MKCLLVSDLHYALKQFDWVLSVAQDFDVVVIAGDHLDISSAVEARVQITVILTYLKRLHAKTRLLVSSGNHDLDARNAAGEKFAKWLSKARSLGALTDGDCLTIDGALFTICPWWDGPQTREQVAVQLARDAEKPKDSWIWVYHAPPDASPTSWGGQKYFGDADLVRWIQQYQPDIVLTGHIHQSPFRQGGSWVDQLGATWIFNSGRQIGPCPTYTVFDTDEQMALWFSLAGAEVVRLDAPLRRPVPELTELPTWLNHRVVLGSRSEPGVHSSSC
jgi:Icc-related predicted phosphoesterase